MAKKQVQRLPKVAFTQADFKVADRFGKMYMRMVQPNSFDLNDQDERYFKKLLWLYPMLAEGQPRRKIMAALEELDGGLWRNQVVGLIKDAERLFANVGKTNKKLERWVQREELKELIQLIKDEFLTKQKFMVENADNQEVEVLRFTTTNEIVLQAIEQIRKLRADIAKLEHLDKPDDDDNDGDEMPEVSFDDSQIEAELAEYEEIAKNSLHE